MRRLLAAQYKSGVSIEIARKMVLFMKKVEINEIQDIIRKR